MASSAEEARACPNLRHDETPPTVVAISNQSPLAACANEQTPLTVSGHEAYFHRAVVVLGLGFLGIFSGFQAAQGLQTSLNATLGGINLACLYGTFTLLCLVAPPLLAGLEQRLGLRVMFLLSAMTYVAMVLSNLIKTSANPSPMWAVPIAMNVLVGIGAPLLWTAQNAYVARCATKAAVCQAGSEEGSIEHWTATMTTRYTSLFFAIYQFSGMIGNVLASVLLLALAGGEDAKRVLFVVLGGFSTIGALTFLTLPAVSGDSNASGREPTLLDTARLAFSDARTGLFIPLMLTNGMTIAFFTGDFQTDITCPLAGSGYTGFVVATFFGVNALASHLWGRAITSGLASRRTAFILATLCIGVYLVVKTSWQVPHNYVQKAGSTDWTRVSDPAPSSLVIAFALAGLFACGDAFFEAGPPMVLQAYYSGTDKVVPAMANYKLWQSLGFAVQFPLGVLLHDYPTVRGVILMVLLGISIVCTLVLDRFVARLDPVTAPGGQDVAMLS